MLGGASPAWSLITVTYNSADMVRRFWREPPSHVQWIVVDNDSSDDSAAAAKGLGADVVRLERNIGFGRANNIGLHRATGTHTLFVNPDVQVDYDDLPRLAATVDENGGLVAPQLLNTDGTMQHNGRGLPFFRAKLAHRGVAADDALISGYLPGIPDSPLPYFVAWTMGAALAGRTEQLRGLGGWDPRFFIYYEDHEMGLRAWEHGLSVSVDPRVRWVHGWARETIEPSVRPWVHEIASMARFYRKRPELISRRMHQLHPNKSVDVPGIGAYVNRSAP